LQQRSIIDILRDSLADKPYSTQTVTKMKPPQSSDDNTQNEAVTKTQPPQSSDDNTQNKAVTKTKPPQSFDDNTQNEVVTKRQPPQSSDDNTQNEAVTKMQLPQSSDDNTQNEVVTKRQPPQSSDDNSQNEAVTKRQPPQSSDDNTQNEAVTKMKSPHSSDDNSQNEAVTKRQPPHSSDDNTQNEVRYKLIIDPSEDESITRLLFMFDILDHENTRTYICSDFLGDGQLQKVNCTYSSCSLLHIFCILYQINTIAAIRHSAVVGHTVIMSQTDDIHESFYDLFNQNFRKIVDPKSDPRYFTNIAIGAHLKPSRVDQNFQCIVVVKESEINNTPAPFLNRFEKYFISHTSLLNLMLDKLPPCLKVIVNLVYKKVSAIIYLLVFTSNLYIGSRFLFKT